MARYVGPVCRHCRREGMKLYLKGYRCFTDKCAIDKRNYAPGQHGQKRPKLSEYGLQLREKQKAKRIYGVFEQQFKNYFEKADKRKGITGENLLRLLELRLDSVIYRSGLGSSMKESRQLVRHGHFLVNGKKVNIPSCQIKVGDVIRVREGSREIEPIKDAPRRAEQRGLPDWLDLDKESLTATVKAWPQREDMPTIIQEQLVVELYSK
ncbi:MAG: 30S ribosomal protein S4 [Candidatus Tectomicrobia bacterium]|uniref:Small ribosomal subunit protein uS4 n=1 Tax=Tectimicrobiota bacterium TaxID=2528274 RepID=A0A932CQH0_UNCTE|nr:30S ribosomal protein S4 [Candidatus Tectomicrobia bacterium]